MVIAKRQNLDNIFIFLFLIIFPFGQIIRIGILQPIDIVVGLAAAYSIIKKQEVSGVFKQLRPFLFFAGVSWLFSIFNFHQINILYGLLYLLRLIAYFYFGVYVWNFVKKKVGNKKLLLDSLLSLSLISALFGWIQYFAFPSIKPFFVWGWDEHLFRLVGTFLDPTFLGLILVFGAILSIHRYIVSKEKINILATIFLLVSLAFTYSRASYLALFAGVVSIAYFQEKIRKYIYILFGFLILVFMLPTSGNHILSFTRTFSALARIENYQNTLKIFSKSSVFGVGYDNMCIAYQKYIGMQDFSSHACSGSDSSLLFILATTGVVGFMALVFSWRRIASSLPHTRYYTLLTTSFIALLVHSLFSNSIFYPWILGWIFVLLAEV